MDKSLIKVVFDYNGSKTGFENQYVFLHGTKTGFEKLRNMLRRRISRIQDGRKGACNQCNRHGCSLIFFFFWEKNFLLNFFIIEMYFPQHIDLLVIVWMKKHDVWTVSWHNHNRIWFHRLILNDGFWKPDYETESGFVTIKHDLSHAWLDFT